MRPHRRRRRGPGRSRAYPGVRSAERSGRQAEPRLAARLDDAGDRPRLVHLPGCPPGPPGCYMNQARGVGGVCPGYGTIRPRKAGLTTGRLGGSGEGTVAGASGFVGRRLCVALDQAGHNVVALPGTGGGHACARRRPGFRHPESGDGRLSGRVRPGALPPGRGLRVQGRAGAIAFGEAAARARCAASSTGRLGRRRGQAVRSRCRACATATPARC